MLEEAETARRNLTPAMKRHRTVGALGCMLAIALGISGLLLGRMGQLWIGFDVFAQFTVQLIIVTLVFCIALLLPRAKVAIGMGLTLLLVAAYGAWPLLFQDNLVAARASAPLAGSLKVVTFNTWMENSAPADVIREIARQDADVMTLVEFGSEKQKLLPSLRALYPYQVTCASDTPCNFAILSKYPLRDVASRMIWEGPPFLRAKLGGEFDGLTVVAVHTTRFPHARAQFKQAKALAADLQSLPGPKLVMGDFNATPFSRVIDTISNDADLQRFTFLPSWPAYIGLPQLAIDHIFASSGITAVEAPRLGDSAGSDHFPVSMRIKVPAALLGD